MARPKSDRNLELFKQFEAARAKRPGLSLADFCRRKSLNYNSIHKAFQRLEKSPPPAPPSVGQNGRNGRKGAVAPPDSVQRKKAPRPEPQGFTGTRGRRREESWTADKAEIFLRALAVEGNASVAAHVAALPRSTIYEARKNDPKFALAWDDALADALARKQKQLLDSAFDWALTGVDKPVFYKGVRVDEGQVKERSESLMGKLLAAYLPEMFNRQAGRAALPGHEAAGDILDRLVRLEISPIEAAAEFIKAGLPVPPFIEALIAKEPPAPPAVEFGLSEEELEAEYARHLSEIERQRAELPAREAHVKALREANAGRDSFSPAALAAAGGLLKDDGPEGGHE